MSPSTQSTNPSLRRQAVSNYVDYAAMHGVGDVKRTWQHQLWRAFYVICTTAFTVLCVINSWMVFKDFMDFPITTSVKLLHATDAHFPAVTVCNLNMLRVSHLGPTITAVLADTSAWVTMASRNWSEVMASEPESNLETLIVDSVGENVYQLWTDVGQTGHQIEDMLIDCEFLKTQCDPRNFTHWISPIYGNCYTFVANRNDSHAFIGPGNGLKLTLFVEDNEYMSVSASVGFRVDIHEPEYIPFPEDNGFTSSVGSYTSVGVRQLQIKRTPRPYDHQDCGKYGDEYAENNLYKHWQQLVNAGFITQVNYTQKSCEKSCHANLVYQKCHCADTTLLTAKQVELAFNKEQGAYPTVCNRFDELVSKCLKEVSILVNTGLCNTICPSACLETSFETSVTSSLWPRSSIVNDKLAQWQARVPALSHVSTVAEVKESIGKLEIYLEELNYESIEESAKYNFWSFMSGLGGTFGLWTGLSLLGLMQLLELAVLVLCGNQFCHRGNTISRDSNDEVHTRSTEAWTPDDRKRHDDQKSKREQFEAKRREHQNKNQNYERHVIGESDGDNDTDWGKSRDRDQDRGRDRDHRKDRDRSRDRSYDQSRRSHRSDSNKYRRH